jgi:serine/threonine protein kinase
LARRFKISKFLAASGFGRTYLGEYTQREGNPICVVKELMPARRDQKFLQVARRLFNTEAEILAVLGKHPQIPELFAYFEED